MAKKDLSEELEDTKECPVLNIHQLEQKDYLYECKNCGNKKVLPKYIINLNCDNCGAFYVVTSTD